MTANSFLSFLNAEFHRLHHDYESLFWDAYMGNAKVGKKKDKALAALDTFRSNPAHKVTAEEFARTATGEIKERLETWVRFFNLYQIPPEAQAVRKKIAKLETEIQQNRAAQREGYDDPKTGKFILASTLKMRTMMQTSPDERVRKACFLAREKLALTSLKEYVVLIQLRNQFAQILGYADFYDYKLRHIDGLTKNELFTIFAEITEAVQPNFAAIKELEKTKRGLRQPWNFGYYMTGDFTAREDQYYPFTEAVPRWLESFGKLGVSFAGGSLTLDLVERKGKYNNGFCHWPSLVRYERKKRIPGAANFTCNVTPGQVGSGVVAYQTLFHEGGHAAHFLNSTRYDVCLNHEYAPMTAAWAETQSMFMDTMFASEEWRSRYAKNKDGVLYPFALFEEKTKATALLRPGRIMSIIFIATFERQVYELDKPTPEKILKIATSVYRQCFNHATDSLLALNTPHIYSFESACSYHGYGLAEIALHQWREYFYKKYGYIVDNGAVGKEMMEAWSWGAQYDFKTCIKKVTGQKLHSRAFLKHITSTPQATIREAKKRIAAREGAVTKTVASGATIQLVHGKTTIADNSRGVREMASTYAAWYEKRT